MRLLKTIVIFIMLSFAASCGTENYHLNILFDNVEGVTEESEVWVNGLQVGEVEQMELFKKGVVVTVSIDDKHKIPVGSEFELASSGFFTGRNVVITMVNVKSFLKDGDTIQGQLYTNTDNHQILERMDSLANKVVKALNEKNTP